MIKPVTDNTEHNMPLFHFPPLMAEKGTSELNQKDNDDRDENGDYNSPTEAVNDHILNMAVTRESNYAPLLVIVDFDNTLAVLDDRGILEKKITSVENYQPSLYSRPFMLEFLKYLKYVNSNNVLILWTAGTEAYIHQSLLLLNIAHYFDQVLSRRHCKESMTRSGGHLKSYQYLVEKFPQYKHMRSILVDNYAFENGAHTGYTEVLSVKPYCLSDVVKTYGVFNTEPESIKRMATFLASKGMKGKRKTTDYWRRYNGDVTLLNVMLFLQKRFFDLYVDSEAHYSATTTINKHLITSPDGNVLEIVPLNMDEVPFRENIISLTDELFFMGNL